ncbi:MAG: hypothetical protein KKF67_00580 [Nanoarchaeota archaeon]|nr:hypothetical protein [Nanoarchaeota archaeon]
MSRQEMPSEKDIVLNSETFFELHYLLCDLGSHTGKSMEPEFFHGFGKDVLFREYKYTGEPFERAIRLVDEKKYAYVFGSLTREEQIKLKKLLNIVKKVGSFCKEGKLEFEVLDTSPSRKLGNFCLLFDDNVNGLTRKFPKTSSGHSILTPDYNFGDGAKVFTGDSYSIFYLTNKGYRTYVDCPSQLKGVLTTFKDFLIHEVIPYVNSNVVCGIRGILSKYGKFYDKKIELSQKRIKENKRILQSRKLVGCKI